MAARTLLRTTALAALLACGAATAGSAADPAQPAPASAQSAATVTTSKLAPDLTDVVARGKYLTDVGDCASCHTHNGGARFAGGRYMGMPFGDLVTPNITPDKEFGVGLYTDDQWVRVFHDGINRKGQYIYPAMPYPWFTAMKRDDILAMKAYLFSTPPVHQKVPPNKVWFPFTLRPGIAVWDALLVKGGGEFKDDPAHSALVNRGDYIVNTFQHCSECHNGRTLLGSGKIAWPLQGGVITHWATPDITNNQLQGIGQYTDDQVFTYLKTGADDVMGTAVGPMRETVDISLSKLRDEDIRAIVAYLRTQDRGAGYSYYRRAAYNVAQPPGSATYLSFCASCHGNNGEGVKGKIPVLDRNLMVNAFGPQNIINVIIGGVQAYGSFGVMPALGNGMSDRQIADVSNYVRQAWHNGAPPNATPALVAADRVYADGAAGDLLNLKRPGGCPTLVQPQLAKIMSDRSNGVAEDLQKMTVATMLQTVDTVIGKVKQLAPGIKQADIVDGLTVAYCPIIAAEQDVDATQRSYVLDNFSTRVYTQLTTNGTY